MTYSRRANAFASRSLLNLESLALQRTSFTGMLVTRSHDGRGLDAEYCKVMELYRLKTPPGSRRSRLG